jgi:alkaline phosphatase
MKRSIIGLLLGVAACGPGQDGPPSPAPDGAPLNIVLMIGDGTGLEYWNAAKIASGGTLALEAFPVVGLVDTESANSRITDSAAGGTAYASGVRTLNGAVGVGPDSVPVPTVLELAERRGWATGLVATSSITHATPAAFAAHVPSRGMNGEIAEQMAAQGIDVILGGGRRYFSGELRSDGLDLLTPLTRGAVYVEDAPSFFALDMDTVSKLVGLLWEDHPGSATNRTPSLAELTRAALTVLAKDADGFFLMVEASQIDWRGHENAPIREVVAEVWDFELAIGEALNFQQRHPNTLIIVTADHSTGGLALHPDDAGVFGAHYTTTSHTAGMVPLFAAGPGAPAFGGIMNNDRVGRLLLHAVREGRVEPVP